MVTERPTGGVGLRPLVGRCAGLLGLSLLLTCLALPPLARSQEGAETEPAAQPSSDSARATGDLAAPQEFCVTPEEMAVIELVQHRNWELQRREEILSVEEQAIRELLAEVRDDVKRLVELRNEIEALLEAREVARREGGDALVQMVNQMKPAAAAVMLSQMEPMLAAAILERLSPRQAGRILGAMEPAVAAALGGSLAVDPIQPETTEEP